MVMTIVMMLAIGTHGVLSKDKFRWKITILKTF